MLQTYTGKCSYTAGSSQGGFVAAPPQAAAAAIVVVAVSHVIKNQNLLGCERLPTKKRARGVETGWLWWENVDEIQTLEIRSRGIGV